MNCRYRSVLHGRVVAAVLMAAHCIVLAAAENPSLESERLAAVVRQLDLIDRTVREAESLPADAPSRYRFDYGRLRVDITRVRGGIQAYLIPERAQPRDPSPLVGDYTLRNESEEISP